MQSPTLRRCLLFCCGGCCCCLVFVVVPGVVYLTTMFFPVRFLVGMACAHASPLHHAPTLHSAHTRARTHADVLLRRHSGSRPRRDDNHHGRRPREVRTHHPFPFRLRFRRVPLPLWGSPRSQVLDDDHQGQYHQRFARHDRSSRRRLLRRVRTPSRRKHRDPCAAAWVPNLGTPTQPRLCCLLRPGTTMATPAGLRWRRPRRKAWSWCTHRACPT